MKIQYASDLHLEFLENSSFLENNPIQPIGDVLVLSGDIGYLNHETYLTHCFWDWASEHFEKVLVVPGNHEFYAGYDLNNMSDGMVISIRHNIDLCYNKSLMIGDVEFLLTTLWAWIPPDATRFVERSISDFRCIRYNNHPLTAAVFNELHLKCREFLVKALSKRKKGKRIVVSHHVPTFLCLSDEFKGSIHNGAFVVDLTDLIMESDIDYWIYGHSHRNIGDVIIGRTKLLSNQLGYINWREYKLFDLSCNFIV
jgi:hypothetical protein